MDEQMTVEELRAILAQLEWSQSELAERLGRGNSRVRKMCRGREAVDPETAKWLRKLAAIDARAGKLLESPPPRPELERGDPNYRKQG